jgi:hypothetical protein
MIARDEKSAIDPARSGYWAISRKHAVQNDLLDHHIRYLVSRVGLPRYDLRSALIDTKATMRIFCYWDNYSGNRVPMIDPELDSIVTASGGTVEVDVYPQKH